MQIILHPDGHADIECDEGEVIVADGSGKKLTEREAQEMVEALKERQTNMEKNNEPL